MITGSQVATIVGILNKFYRFFAVLLTLPARLIKNSMIIRLLRQRDHAWEQADKLERSVETFVSRVKRSMLVMDPTLEMALDIYRKEKKF